MLMLIYVYLFMYPFYFICGKFSQCLVENYSPNFYKIIVYELIQTEPYINLLYDTRNLIYQLNYFIGISTLL